MGAARGVPFPVVGIGASAGGLEAISTLLHELPPDPGMAFVVVQHLDPHYESQLPELLGKATAVPVLPVIEGMEIERDRVYIIPPNSDVTVRDGALHLMPRQPGPHMPIDIFFASLAVAQGSAAIGVVLSGNASDGSTGVRMIKGEFGLTFAQDEVTARYPGMPRNAIATGAIDFVMKPEQIGRELLRIREHPFVKGLDGAEPDNEILPEGDAELRRIFEVLLAATKVDFSQYKRTTIRRRIGRRMVVQRTKSLAEYANYLDEHRVEAAELYRDLLINVTNFFREPDAFTALTRQVANEMRARRTMDPFRVWVPGCASGEELYSLAICLYETQQEIGSGIPFQFFGTDINEIALEKGRGGIYPAEIAADVSPERLQKFFTRVEGGYQICPTIRECCVFARQDLSRDPPFAHTDLITCRNVLIYMDSALQRRVLPVLHYSLKPTGLLMLGSAETTGSAPELFDAIDKQHHIYARRAVPVRLTLDLSVGRSMVEAPRPTQPLQALSSIDLIKKVDRVIQSKYSPAAVVVDADLKILHFRGQTSYFFDPAPGDATLNLLRMVRESLVVALRRNIEAASQQGISVRETGILVEHRGEQRTITVEVTPIPGVAKGEQYFLLVFEDDFREDGEREQPSPSTAIPDSSAEYFASLESSRRQLQYQLTETREYLRNLNEDHEAGMEELRAANEEVRSSNEELQSTNEELSTTKEELQSANEELTTVNEELQSRNHELDVVNNDLGNLLTAVSIPIVMVDNALCVRRYNPAGEKVLELTALDIGRPIAQAHGNMDVPGLDILLKKVLDTLVTQQQDVRDGNGRWYSMIARPFRTSDNKIDGAVIVFVDIDPLKRSLTLAEEARDYADGMIETVREPLIVLDQDLRVQRANLAFFDMFRVSREETLGRLFYDLGSGQWNKARLREMLGNALFNNQPFQDFEIVHDFPHIGQKTMRLNAKRIPRQDDSLNRVVLVSIEDISVRQAVAEIRYRRLFESAKDGMVVVDLETELVTDVNPHFLALTGWTREDLVGKPIDETPVFRYSGIIQAMENARDSEMIRLDRTLLNPRLGRQIDMEVVANRYSIGTQTAVQLNVRDITSRRREERARAEAEAALSLANDRLRKANTELEQFAYAASHDIQEPLRTISLYTELLNNELGPTMGASSKEFLGYIHDSATRLQRLVGDLLSYTRSTASIEVPSTTIDANNVLQAALENLRTVLDENQAIVSFHQLPDVRMHETHLLQIFQNLIGNAVKYRGVSTPRVSVTAADEEGEVLFAVTDNGIGVAPEQAKTIFLLFERLRGHDRPGTGIGLAICAKIIENYGGYIWVESVPEGGSRFLFTIPKV